MSEGLLIIGSSQAGVRLAASLRALGYTDPITLLGDENHRPALSKEFLQSAIAKESLIFRTQDYWDEHRIAVVKNERILRINKESDGSGVAHARSGTEFPFDRLALTVGARARRLQIEGADLPGVLYLRNADDALELKARAQERHTSSSSVAASSVSRRPPACTRWQAGHPHRGRSSTGRASRRRGDLGVPAQAPRGARDRDLAWCPRSARSSRSVMLSAVSTWTHE